LATITDIEFIWIRIPLAHDFRGSVYHVPEKNAIITRIRTSDGLVGECMNGEGGADVHAHILHLLQNGICAVADRRRSKRDRALVGEAVAADRSA